MNVTRERMLAYLYDELSSQERAAFEAELAASEADRRELAELDATLRQVRAGLQLDAEPPVPARVRANVLAAAQEQLLASRPHDVQAQPSATATPRSRPLAAAPDTPAQPSAAASPQRFWRWLRGALIVPSLAMAAVAALLVFARREPLPSLHVTPITPESGLEGEAAPSAPPPQPTAAPSAPPTTADSETSPAPPQQPPADARAPAPAQQPPAAKAARAPAPAAPEARGAQAKPRDAKRFAQPPSGWTRERAASAEPSSTVRTPAESARDSEGASFGQGEAAPTKADRLELAPAEKAARPMAQPRARGAAAAPEAEAAPPSAPRAEQPAAAPPGPTSSQLAAPDLEKRARNYEAAERWDLASADYRELLERFPEHPRANIWRNRLSVASQALSRPPPSAAPPPE